MMKTVSFRHVAMLGSFCLAFGSILAYSEPLNEPDTNALNQVLPAGNYDNNPLKTTLSVKNTEGKEVTVYRALKGGKGTGVAFEIHNTCYSGEVKLVMGVDAGGKIIGVRTLAHKETPGRGDKIDIKRGDWILGFTGLSLGNPPVEQWKIKKDGGHFDQFAGATTTPRCVVAAVRQGLEFFAANKAQLIETK